MMTENMIAKILMKISANRCWYWTAVGHNGETIANSEMYSSKAACKRTAKDVAKQLKVQVFCS